MTSPETDHNTREEINNHNTNLINNEENDPEEDNTPEEDNQCTCIICFETIASLSDMYVSRCHHTWCIDCHRRLKEMQHETCVVCREPLKRKKKKRRKRHSPYTYNDIHDEIDYEPTFAFGYTRPWRVKRRLRREIRSLLAQIKLRSA